MKKVVCMFSAFLLMGSFAFSQALVQQDSAKNKKSADAFKTGNLQWNSSDPKIFHLDKVFKQYEEEMSKKLFISKIEYKNRIASTGEAPFPFDDNPEFVETKGEVIEKYLVPIGFDFVNRYHQGVSEEKYHYYASSFDSYRLLVRLNDDTEILLNFSSDVNLTKEAAYAWELAQPIEYAVDRGISYPTKYRTVTEAERQKCKASDGTIMVGSDYNWPSTDPKMEKELNFYYSPKYYRIEVRYYKSNKPFDCTTPWLEKQGLKCTVWPSISIEKGKQTVEFYVVPDIEALAKDLKFVREAVKEAVEKKK